MYILNWYIIKQYLSVLLMAVFIVTFLVSGQYALKLIEYISEGASTAEAIQYCILIIPQALAFSIPWGSLVAVMLVFGRLSADNEIVSMRSCGVSILQIVSPLIVIVFLLTCLCLYLQLEVSQPNLGKARDLVRAGATRNPLVGLKPGIPLELGDMRIFIDRKDEDGNVYGVQIFIPNKQSGDSEQDIMAPRGHIEIDDSGEAFFYVENALIESSDSNGKRQYGFSEFTRIPVGGLDKRNYNKRKVTPDDKYLDMFGLFARSAYLESIGRATPKEIVPLKLQLNERIALALGPLAFLLLGLPLAIQSSRKETSIGLFFSVVLGTLYYAGALLPDQLEGHPEAHPEYLVWIMPILYQTFGLYYLIKVARK